MKRIEVNNNHKNKNGNLNTSVFQAQYVPICKINETQIQTLFTCRNATIWS